MRWMLPIILVGFASVATAEPSPSQAKGDTMGAWIGINHSGSTPGIGEFTYPVIDLISRHGVRVRTNAPILLIDYALAGLAGSPYIARALNPNLDDDGKDGKPGTIWEFAQISGNFVHRRLGRASTHLSFGMSLYIMEPKEELDEGHALIPIFGGYGSSVDLGQLRFAGTAVLGYSIGYGGLFMAVRARAGYRLFDGYVYLRAEQTRTSLEDYGPHYGTLWELGFGGGAGFEP